MAMKMMAKAMKAKAMMSKKMSMKKMSAKVMKKSMKMKMAKKMVMKAMKKRVMKKSAKSYKTVSGAARAVWSGKIATTKGGLKKSQLMKSRSGKIVSAKKSAAGKKNKWMSAVAAARKALSVKGFQVIGGKSAKGQALLKKARSLYKKK
jgi:hypothetical protein